MEDSKNCTRCSTAKPFADFYNDRKGRFGLSAYCKSCMKAKSKAHRELNPRRKKDLDLRYKFNITIEQFDAMMEAQGGTCAICGGVNANGRALSVDHDHACCPGKESCGSCVRSLLCGDCNMGLGKFRDDPELLRAAIDYLKR